MAIELFECYSNLLNAIILFIAISFTGSKIHSGSKSTFAYVLLTFTAGFMINDVVVFFLCKFPV